MMNNKKYSLVILVTTISLIGVFFLVKKTESPQSQKSEVVVQESSPKQVIQNSRIVKVEVLCLGFDDKIKKVPFYVVDTIADDVKAIFSELLEMKFPVYYILGYYQKDILNTNIASLHSYGAAIDINVFTNPYFDVENSLYIPRMFEDPKGCEHFIVKELRRVHCSEEEIKKILEVVIQPKGSDDRFLNREIIRKSMITKEIVEVFKKHGFNEWGGHWRQPMDFMHFQVPRRIAEQLANSNPEQAKKIWRDHIEKCRRVPE